MTPPPPQKKPLQNLIFSLKKRKKKRKKSHSYWCVDNRRDLYNMFHMFQTPGLYYVVV